MHNKRLYGSIAVSTLTMMWLAGCGGVTSSSNSPTSPSTPSIPSTNQLRLYQHGDEFVYTVSGVARYLEQRYEVSGTRTVRIRSAGAGVLRYTWESRLRLRRGADTYNDDRMIVYTLSQNRQSREVTLLGYSADPDGPMINADLPYRVFVPGILNENSNFTYSTPFENQSNISRLWQIGRIEPVQTYAGQYSCYQVREEFEFDYPFPFVEYMWNATCWFSPQLGVMVRSETIEQGWLNGEPIEYRLTEILQRTNVSLQSATP